MPDDAEAEGEPMMMMEEVVKGIDPAIYLLLAVVLMAVAYFVYTRKFRSENDDDFFTNLDGEKVSVSMFIILIILTVTTTGRNGT